MQSLPRPEPAAADPVLGAPPPIEALADMARDLAAGGLAPEDLELAPIIRRYRECFEEFGAADLDAVGDFLSLTARLMFTKSARLLAQPVDDSAGEKTPDSGSQWLGPDTLAEVAGRFRTLEGRESLPALDAVSQIERRAEPRPASLLQRAWREMAARRDEPEVDVHVPAYVRLESAVSALIRRLKSSIRIPFHRLVAGGNRSEVVLQFLAVLELLRRRSADVEQSDLFGEMTVEYREEPTERAARAG